MAYDDSPLVDDNAKRSEESVLRVLLVLSLKNGFSCQPVHPDYGVDLNVELLENGRQASSQQFAVQIKSTKRLRVVNREQQRWVALSFATSRLRYLNRRQPTGGSLLVLYDERRQQCYYEHAGALLQQLNAADPAGSWRSQRTVTVYLNPDQVLTDATAARIHATLSAACQRLAQLEQQHGAEYDLPLFRSPAATTAQVNLRDVNQVAQLVETYGGTLFNRCELPQLLDMLGRLPTAVITASARLTFLAAITYAQVGDQVEGAYYLARCRPHRPALDPESNLILDLTHIRLEFLRGEVDLSTYSARLAALATESASDQNRLVLQVNALFFELINCATEDLQARQVELAARVQQLFAAIEAAQLEPNDRLMLTVHHSESLQLLGSRLRERSVATSKIRQLLGSPMPPEELATLRASWQYLQTARHYVSTAYEHASAQESSQLRATAAQYLSRYALNDAFDTMLLDPLAPPLLTPARQRWFIASWDLAGEAYNLFQGMSLWKDAHQSLTNLVELEQLYQLAYNQPLGTKTLADCVEQLRRLEEQFNLPAFHSLALKAYTELTAHLRSPATLTEQVTRHGGVATYARQLLAARNLPSERLANLTAELEAHLRFEAICRNPQLHLRTLPASTSEAAYAGPPSYLLHDDVTGRSTLATPDLEQLLAAYHSWLAAPPTGEVD